MKKPFKNMISVKILRIHKGFYLIGFIAALILSFYAGTLKAESPQPVLSIIKKIYLEKDPDILFKTFSENILILKNDSKAFDDAFENIFASNNQVNLLDLKKKNILNKEEQTKLSIRITELCLFKMGELDQTGNKLLQMFEDLKPLRQRSWRSEREYDLMIYNSLAKSSPEKLNQMLISAQIPNPELATLALVRYKYSINQDRIKIILNQNKTKDAWSLLYYITEAKFKLEYFEDNWKNTKHKSYIERCWFEREMLNLLASFPEGIKRLEKLKKDKEIHFENFDGIYFTLLKGSGVNKSHLKSNQSSIQLIVNNIKKINLLLGGLEKIYLIDVTPSRWKNEELNTAGWGENSLYLTKNLTEENSPRAVSFIMAHEACEQKYVKGLFSSKLGLSYLDALENETTLELFRLGSRVGGKFKNSGYGHPWDSEREWLAEVCSSFIIDEDLGKDSQTALDAMKELFYNSY